MDKELKEKIIRHYTGEYREKIYAEDKSFLNRFEKFSSHNEMTLWGLAGMSIAGFASAAMLFPAAILTPVVLTPAILGGGMLLGSWPAACTYSRTKNLETARKKIIEDIENGSLEERYNKEVLEKKTKTPADALKELEAAKLAVEFEAAKKKEQEAVEASKALTEEHQKKLKESAPAKPVLKKSGP